MPPRRRLITGFVLLFIALALLLASFFWKAGAPARLTVADLPPPKPPPPPQAPPPIPLVLNRPPPPRATGMDSGIRQMTDELQSPGGSAQRDVQIIANLMDEYRRAFQGNPSGDNTDITAALLGDPSGPGRFLPNTPALIRGGQLVDRWGTPYWFHPNSGSQMEIRSAGPDKNLFTSDDIVQNPSPSGFGATPAVEETAP
jgi:hypothetical protein